jgi:eukaryotic-like serine/threonine-protein kinase
VGLPREDGATPKDRSGKIEHVYPWGGDWPPPSGAGNFAGSEAADADWISSLKPIEGYRDAFPRTAPVGSFQADRHGLFDLSGNVWEWCEDFYDGQSGSRVLRGGSWLSYSPRYLLSSSRNNCAPGNRDGSYGFRVVLVVGESR